VPAIFAKEAGETTGCWPSWSEGTESTSPYGIHQTKDAVLQQEGEFLLILDDYYFYLYATTLTIYFFICYFWLFGTIIYLYLAGAQSTVHAGVSDRLRKCFTYSDAFSAPITKATTVSITGWEEE
jgi:hypothetical protein